MFIFGPYINTVKVWFRTIFLYIFYASHWKCLNYIVTWLHVTNLRFGFTFQVRFRFSAFAGLWDFRTPVFCTKRSAAFALQPQATFSTWSISKLCKNCWRILVKSLTFLWIASDWVPLIKKFIISLSELLKLSVNCKVRKTALIES